MKTVAFSAILEAVFVVLNCYSTRAIDCPPNQFKCSNHTFCVPHSWKCDGTNDCPDGTDEKGCGRPKCGSAFFTCNNGKCILTSWKCDGQDDCGDNSDERSEICSEKPSCEFRCDNGNCLASVWVCDNYDDCGDNSDEKRCGKNATEPSNANMTSTTPATLTTPTTIAPTTPFCSSNEFECGDGKQCIPKEWKCDDADDCNDKSDEQGCGNKPERNTTATTFPTFEEESYGQDGTDGITTAVPSIPLTSTGRFVRGFAPTRTVPSVCSQDQFLCKTGTCTYKVWRCDGDNDCGDNSDEQGCGIGITTTVSSTTPSSAESNVRAVCSQGQFLCKSGTCTFEAWRCDGDDDCGDNSDEQNCGTEGTNVAPTRAPSPGCRQGYFLCRTNSGTCIPESWRCDGERDCGDGSDEVSCMKNRSILVATGSRIKDVSEDLQSVNDVFTRLRAAAALDVDIQTQLVYWSDIIERKIKRGNLYTKTTQEVILSDIGVVEGIAVDWVARKLYWTDSLYSSIEVAELQGQNRKKLIENLDKPRAIVVHPLGYMFWTEWGAEPRLSRCSMDGKPETKKVLINRDILWPNALTIDYSTNTLWWADAKLKKIESCRLDGTGRKIFVRNAGYPFSIAVTSSYIYWSNWETKSLDRIGLGSSKIMTTFSSHPLGITLLDGEKHKAIQSECMVNKGGCSHLCLLANSQERFSCQCPNGMKLGNDGKRCLTVGITRCPSGKFLCDETLCIDKSKRCDGKQDCKDNADEHYCLANKPWLIYGNMKGRSGHIGLCDLTEIHKCNTLSGRIGLCDLKEKCKVLTNVESVTAIDVDLKNGYLFWADTVKNAIMKSALSYSGDLLGSEIVTDTYVRTPEGLAFDWITSKLYWIDSQYGKIEVIDVEGKYRYSLVENLVNARSIALHPILRCLYWTVWGSSAYIGQIGMDGDPDSRRKVVSTGIIWPNAVTIDYATDNLYWADAYKGRSKLEVLNTRGVISRDIFFENKPNHIHLLSHPFSLTVDDKYIYWSDWHWKAIYMLDKNNKKKDFLVKRRLGRPMGLVVLNRSRQKQVVENPCAVHNGGCTHICLLSQSRPFTCRCPSDMRMLNDSRTCQSLYHVEGTRVATNSLRDAGLL